VQGVAFDEQTVVESVTTEQTEGDGSSTSSIPSTRYMPVQLDLPELDWESTTPAYTVVGPTVPQDDTLTVTPSELENAEPIPTDPAASCIDPDGIAGTNGDDTVAPRDVVPVPDDNEFQVMPVQLDCFAACSKDPLLAKVVACANAAENIYLFILYHQCASVVSTPLQCWEAERNRSLRTINSFRTETPLWLTAPGISPS
jgi:hypothetical protein